jgi:hypothetical protein
VLMNKRPLQLLEEFMDADINLEYGIGDKLFVRFVRLLVVLAHFGVVIGILAAGGLAIWAYGNGAVFLYHHWPWVIAGVCILLLAGRLIGKRNKG